MKIPILVFVALCISVPALASNRQWEHSEGISVTSVKNGAAIGPIATMFVAVSSARMKADKQPQSIAPRNDIPTLAKAANGIVVSVVTLGKDGHSVAQGSGFFASKDGRIVTNYHVIQNGNSAIVKLRDGALFVVDGLLAFDKDRDVAVIKVHGETLRGATLGNSDQVQVGEQVVAIGNPLDSTVSSGIISGIRTGDRGGGKFFEVTAPISPDSSGGPLFNMAGEVIGITTSNIEVGANLNSAIPINDVKPLLQTDLSKLINFPVDSSDTSKQETGAGVPLTTSTLPAPVGETGSSPAETLVMIYLTSEPEGAEVYVDDSFVGKAPTTLKLKPGKHAIRMFMTNYQNWVEWISLDDGSEMHITATLQRSN